MMYAYELILQLKWPLELPIYMTICSKTHHMCDWIEEKTIARKLKFYEAFHRKDGKEGEQYNMIQAKLSVSLIVLFMNLKGS